MSTEKIEKNIYQKLVSVRSQIMYLQKDSQGHNYKYVSSTALIDTIKPLLDAEGLWFDIEVVDYEFGKTTTKNGGIKDTVTMKLKYTIVNVDNPEEKIEKFWVAYGVNDLEKCLGSALTYSKRYLIMTIFFVPNDEEDPDNHARRLAWQQQQQHQAQQNLTQHQMQFCQQAAQQAVQDYQRQHGGNGNNGNNGNGNGHVQLKADDNLRKNITRIASLLGLSAEEKIEVVNKFQGDGQQIWHHLHNMRKNFSDALILSTRLSRKKFQECRPNTPIGAAPNEVLESIKEEILTRVPDPEKADMGWDDFVVPNWLLPSSLQNKRLTWKCLATKPERIWETKKGMSLPRQLLHLWKAEDENPRLQKIAGWLLEKYESPRVQEEAEQKAEVLENVGAGTET